MIKSRGIILAKGVGGMGENRNTYRFWCVNLNDRHVLQDTGVGELIILKYKNTRIECYKGRQDLFDSLRGKFQALLNMLINLHVPYTLQNFLDR
jgi:hypothetical protein